MDTLQSLLDWTLAASMRAAILTIAVLLVRLALRKQIPARWRYALWLPVLTVLVLPALPESRWSAENIIVVAAPAPAPPARPEIISLPEPEAVPAPPALAPVRPAMTWQEIAALAWVAGVGLSLAVGVGSYASAVRRFGRAAIEPDPALLAQLAELCAELRMYVPRVLQSTAVESPAVAGVLRPVLLLPASFGSAFTREEATLVLKHELIHLRRHDLPMNALLCLVQAIHWFNPLLWWAAARAREDREAACDAQVLESTQGDCRSVYGHALLKVESAFLPRRLCLGFVGIFQRGKALHSRIQAIAMHRRSHPMAGVIAVALIGALTLLGATRAVSAGPAAGSAAEPDSVFIQVKLLDITAGVQDKIVLTPETQAVVAEGALTAEGLAGPAVTVSEQTAKALVSSLEQRPHGVQTLMRPSVFTPAGEKVQIWCGPEVAIKGVDGKTVTTKLGLSGEITATLKGGRIALDASLRYSELLDPATSEVMDAAKEIDSKTRGRPAERNWVRSEIVEMDDGQTLLVSQLRPDGRQRKRLLLCVIQARRIAGAGPPPPEPEKPGSPADKLSRIILPELVLKNMSLEDALQTLSTKARQFDTQEADPHKKGVTINFHREANTKQPPLTLDLKNVSLSEALRYVTGLSGTKYRVTRDAVFVAKPLPPGELVTRGLAINDQFAPRLEIKNGDIKAALMARGVPFPEGARASIIGSGTHQLLMARNTEENLDLIDALIEQFGAYNPSPNPTSTLIVSGAEPSPPLAERLAARILPRLKFSEATVNEALDYLQVQARSKDPKAVVSIIVRLDEAAGSRRITLDRTDISLGDSLRMVANMAGLDMTVTTHAVVLSLPDANAPAPVPQGPGRRADRIILPVVEFNETTLAEAVQFLQAQSLQHDPDKKGVTITILGPPPLLPKVTLSLKEVPLSEAVRYTAELTHLKVRDAGDGYVLVPAAK